MMDNITQQDILSHQWVPSPMWFSFWTSMWGIHADQFSVSKHYIQINEEHWNLFDGIDLRSTAGRILIRDEYLYQYTRLCNLHGSADFLPHGVVLTGSPGVGKSFFAVFGLASQLRDRKTTLFVLADGTVVLFCEAGAFITQKQSSTSITMAPLIRYRGDTPAARFWVFIDASQDFQEPPDDLTNTNAFFPVQCVPPEYSRYKKWIVDGRAAVWIMQPWRMQEFAEG
ncbi:hypothetical protein BXZ70DRAFT_448198 [Cristinia sonorae]|uniref:Uncharacterized protein n=1 Tax=Cristinia sonorae TaxID=1940300 RepID=A0A8K0UK82_9AGAR|nr:hypothetical protein BXZ70DRAFT_448198 [Cristinia sonorae]